MAKLIFNAHLQKETEHELAADSARKEIVATCNETGRQLKFPLVDDVALEALIAEHKTANEGQKPVEEAKV